MKKPDFFIVGAPRCGTTSLYRYLGQHPQVYMAECKEPEYFATDLAFRRAIRDEEDYLALFSGARDGQRIGEASTFYLFSKAAAKNIKEYMPQAKIIIMLRRPIEQMYSFHNMMLFISYWEGAEELVDFSEALAAEGPRKQGLLLPKGNTMPKECYLYREIARYAVQVRRYLEIFGRENVYTIIFDDLKTDAAQVYKHVCAFLDVDTDTEVDLARHNAVGRIRSYTVWRLLRHRHGILRKVFPTQLKGSLLESFVQLNRDIKHSYHIDVSLETQLMSEFVTELKELSELLGRDLGKEWL